MIPSVFVLWFFRLQRYTGDASLRSWRGADKGSWEPCAGAVAYFGQQRFWEKSTGPDGLDSPQETHKIDRLSV
jgi:hypothetical protein